jgi:hypothetical protein
MIIKELFMPLNKCNQQLNNEINRLSKKNDRVIQNSEQLLKKRSDLKLLLYDELLELCYLDGVSLSDILVDEMN